jgi:cytochrome c oxidase subunit II
MLIFSLFPEQASTLAGEYDLLFFSLLGLCSLVAIGIFILMIAFAIKYRRGSPANRTRPPQPLAERRNRRIEYAWIFIPLVLFLGVFTWGADLYTRLFIAPSDALQIAVVGKQWMWKLEHANGQREINELHVPLGSAVQLTMTSQDVIHSFFVSAFRIKHDVLPGRYTTLWFRPTKLGEYRLFCAEYCGTDHSRMGGRIIVMKPDEYEKWLAGHAATGMIAQGAHLFRQYGCSGCHGENATVHAPKLQGLYGKPVPLQGGGMTVADDRYIRDSILMPLKDIAAGYAPIMPSFEGKISEEEILEIIAYIKSLGEDDQKEYR